jgi:hypothetical protein
MEVQVRGYISEDGSILGVGYFHLIKLA